MNEQKPLFAMMHAEPTLVDERVVCVNHFVTAARRGVPDLEDALEKARFSWSAPGRAATLKAREAEAGWVRQAYCCLICFLCI